MNKGNDLELLPYSGETSVLDFEFEETFETEFVAEEGFKDDFLVAFEKLRGNIKDQTDLMSADMWQSIEVPQKVKVRSHDCELEKKGIRQNICKKIRGSLKCFDAASPRALMWRCDSCNFDLCRNCMQVDLQCEMLMFDAE